MLKLLLLNTFSLLKLFMMAMKRTDTKIQFWIKSKGRKIDFVIYYNVCISLGNYLNCLISFHSLEKYTMTFQGIGREIYLSSVIFHKKKRKQVLLFALICLSCWEIRKYFLTGKLLRLLHRITIYASTAVKIQLLIFFC